MGVGPPAGDMFADNRGAQAAGVVVLHESEVGVHASQERVTLALIRRVVCYDGVVGSDRGVEVALGPLAYIHPTRFYHRPEIWGVGKNAVTTGKRELPR